MGLVLAAILAILAMAALILVFRASRRSWEAIAAALMFGLAGFVLQAHRDLGGAPKQASADTRKGGQALVEARQQLSGSGPIAGNRLLVMADGMTRSGEFADAATLALGAAEQEPGNAQAWLALANNLVEHADGNLTPAAEYAFGRAAEADPAAPGPLFFHGLALARGGQLDEGRAKIAAALALVPVDSPWHSKIEALLKDLDSFITRQQEQAGQGR